MALNKELRCLSALLAGALALGASQESLAQSQYYNKDPYSTGCSEGAYPAEYRYVVGEIQFLTWFSPKCGTRYLTLDMRYYQPSWTRPSSIYLHNAAGQYGAWYWNWAGAGWYWSKMMPLNMYGTWAPCAIVRRVDGSVLSNCSYYVVGK
jgi:hypothetical protein